MAVILENRPLTPDVCLLTLSGVSPAAPGQFLQLHIPDGALLLPRPVSVFDADEATGAVSLVYRRVGRGTERLATMRGGELRVTGPLGNGFPLRPGPAVLLGGGLGLAPLHLLAKALRRAEPGRTIRVYLGYSDRVFLADAFDSLADRVEIDVGGYVTDRVDFSEPATYYACGPTPMTKAAHARAKAAGAELWVSLEARMACGVGACYGCSIRTKIGMRRVCKDGPVFRAEEVYDG